MLRCDAIRGMMNILFLSLGNLTDLDKRSVHMDLIKEFGKSENNIYVLSPMDRKDSENRYLEKKQGHIHMVRVRISNLRSQSLIKKGIATLLVEARFIMAIKKKFSGVTFDLVIYTTPPVTFAKVVSYLRKRNGSRSYLLLKDIFPQNAVDLGMISSHGLIYRIFRRKERELYHISDYIGCMSQANIEYLLKHNPDLDPRRVEICPNSLNPVTECGGPPEEILRGAYGIPEGKVVFVFGGNFGKPQGVEFIIECLREEKEHPHAFFLMVGSGTECHKIGRFIESERPGNIKYVSRLPSGEYEQLLRACDVGLIFLDYRFTIPNFPSKLLSYLEAGLPVIAATDRNSDIGDLIEENSFGYKCYSNNVEEFKSCIEKMCQSKALRIELGKRGREFFLKNYTVEKQTEIILKHYR